MGVERAYIIAHSMGEGISELFCALGADLALLCDRQESFSSMLRELIAANESEHIIILPATPEAFADAELLVREANNSALHLVPTRSSGEVYAALAEMSFGNAPREQFLQAVAALEPLASVEILENASGFLSEYVAVQSGERVASSGSAEGAALLAIERLCGAHHRIITLIVGSGVSNASRVFLTERLMEIYPEMQIIVYIGKQNASEYYIALR